MATSGHDQANPGDTTVERLFGVIENIRATPGLRVELSSTSGVINVSCTDCGRWEHTTTALAMIDVVARMLEMTTGHRVAWEARQK